MRRLVLTATSGGVDVAGLGGSEWRPRCRRLFPAAADWIMRERPDHTTELGRVTAPALLLWGDHAFAHERADEVASLVAAHLG